MATEKLHVIGIDCQLDFATKPDTYSGIKTGALYVPGGEEAMSRAATLIKRAMHRIEDVHMTMDSHHRLHIANHTSWRDRKGLVPPPFTPVTTEAIKSGELRHMHSGVTIKYGGQIMTMGKYTEYYTEQLAKGGRFGLTLWPEHCIIGTPGAALVPEIEEAASEFTRQHGGTIDYVFKGSNYMTEHYSAVKAEVPSPDDMATTGLNTSLVGTLSQAQRIWWLGIAGDFCVKSTFLDTIACFGADAIRRCTIVRDAVASINQAATEAFYKEAEAQGVTVCYAKDLY